MMKKGKLFYKIMSNPKISVILPVYNVEKYLFECLDSIINQTLKDIEIICLNDGSTDNSLSILKEYASKDTRIILIDKENEGLGYTRKVGLDNATGKYILFCDSDDYYAELTAFEELYNYIEKVKSDVVIFDFIQKDEITKNINNFSDTYTQNVVFTHRNIENIFDHVALCWQKIYSRDFLTKYDDWYFPKHVKYEDVPFHYQVILRAKISYFNRSFYVWRIRQNSISTKKVSYRNILDNLIITKKIYEITRNFINNLEFLDYFYQFFCIRLFNFFIRDSLFIKDIDVIKQIIETIRSLDTSNLFDLKNREAYFYIRAGLRMTPKNYMEYFNRKILRYANEQIKYRDELIKNQDDLMKYREELLKENKKDIIIKDTLINNQEYLIKSKNSEIQNLYNQNNDLHNQNNDLHNQNNIQNQVIKQLQNSWSYRIGRFFTYPLSVPFEFFKFIRDYYLIKKSNLFDSEYYLEQNEDVKKAKVDPIKHYLKFGWKEGRNPSADFDGNDYLNKRSDVKVAGICPLVHYLKFGKEEDLSFPFEKVERMKNLPDKEYFDYIFTNIENKKYDYLLSKRGEEILLKIENQKRKGKSYKKGTQEEIINEAFDRIDLIFFNNKNKNLNEDILQKYIDTVPNVCPHKLLEIISQRIAEYTFPKRENYIFLDFSILAIVDNKSGIQRVGRNIIKYLPNINKRKIVFVHSSEEEFTKQGFRYCSKIANGTESENEEVIEFIQGDILFFPELPMLQCIGKKEYLQFLRKKGVKIINFVYDLIPIRCPETIPNNGFKEEFQKYIDSVLDYATGIICDSQFVKSDLQRYIRENRSDIFDNLQIEWIHLGSDFRRSSDFMDKLPKDSNIVFKAMKSRITFLAVSTIQPHKMYDQILEAFEILWSKNYDINLVIVGQNGWDSEKLIEKISNHKELNKRLFKLTQISDEYLNKVYEKSSCFIMASKIEGFGLGIIEATYHKKPLLIRDLPVFKEIAGENAFYFSGFNDEDLANAIEEWLLLFNQNKHPKSDKIKYLTWKESIQMLSDKLELLSK